MQPIKLTLNAFGPFRGTEVIDFTKVSRNGIYLITGETGAGKTTILDAIVFALYGSPVSSVRSAEMLRNVSAPRTETTYAELVFEYNGKEYTVRRSPNCTVPKKDGSGTRQINSAAELTRPDGSISRSVYEINREIAEIIGLEKDNFIKVAILAQGKFVDMLYASTPEKTEIFRFVFRTEKYEKLQKRLYDDLKNAEKDRREAAERAQEFIMQIECPEEFEEKLCTAAGPDDKVGAAKDIISADKRSLDKLSKQLEKNESLRTELVKKIERASAANNLKNNINEAKNRIETLKRSLPELEEKLRAAENELPRAKELGDGIAVGKSRLKDYDKLSEYRSEAKNRLMLYERKKEEIRHEEELAERSKKESADDAAEYEARKSSAEKRAELEAAASEKRIRKTALEALTADLKEYTKLIKRKNKLESDCAEKLKEFEAKGVELIHLEKEFLGSQAGLIASKLEEGKPCPVCGSTEHPSPAALYDKNVTREMLDSERQKLEGRRTEFDNASKLYSEASGSAKAKEEALIKTSRELFGEDKIVQQEKLDSEYALAAAGYKSLAEKAKAAADDEKRCSELEKLRRKADESAAEHTVKAKSFEAQAAEYKAKAEAAEASAALLEKNLPSKSREEAEEKIAVLEREKNKIEEEYSAAKKSLGDNRSETDKAEASVNTLKEQLKDYADCSDVDLDGLNAKKIEADAEKKELEKKIAAIRDRIRVNKSVIDGLSDCIDKLNEAEKRYSIIAPLSTAAGGGTDERITLEAYIQAEYLENITALANQRLFEMSGGRYELKRTDKKGSSRKAGLELNITDHWNNTERSVRSLSGGESFEAALSLALGFSDSICAQSGGISLRSMFVDEGFGSLDSSSCRRAVEILHRLSQNGVRTVGIISHIDMLKSELTDCISVKKDRFSGTSHIEIKSET